MHWYIVSDVSLMSWFVMPFKLFVKGIVHFEIKFWYVLAYLKGIQDVGVFFSTVVSILIFLGQAVLVWQSFSAGKDIRSNELCSQGDI